MKKVISITLICSLMIMTLTAPVMALPLELIKTSQQMCGAEDLSSVSGFLDTASPWLSPAAASYADEISLALETREAPSGMADFLEYAGNVFLLISVVMILGGIQMIITGSDISEGLISLLLGVVFFVYAVMMLSEVEAEPAI